MPTDCLWLWQIISQSQAIPSTLWQFTRAACLQDTSATRKEINGGVGNCSPIPHMCKHQIATAFQSNFWSDVKAKLRECWSGPQCHLPITWLEENADAVVRCEMWVITIIIKPITPFKAFTGRNCYTHICCIPTCINDVKIWLSRIFAQPLPRLPASNHTNEKTLSRITMSPSVQSWPPVNFRRSTGFFIEISWHASAY